MSVEGMQLPLALGWLATRYAVWLALGCACIGLPLIVVRTSQRWAAPIGALFRELALVLGLYSLWGYAGQLAASQPTGATQHGLSVWNAERWLHLPNEQVLQGWILPHGWIVKGLNAYYAFVHGPSLMIFLAWLFFRHRDRYPVVRNTLAFLTMTCLLIQLTPVAPPRLIPQLHMIDTAIKYGQSVYPSVGGAGPDQYSAMPSLHIGWAALFTFAAIIVSTSRWRWLMTLHLAMTFAAVTLTANHYWLDGIIAIILIVPSTMLAFGVARVARLVRTRAPRLAIAPM